MASSTARPARPARGWTSTSRAGHGPVTASRRPGRPRSVRRDELAGWLFVLPPLAIFAFVILGPICYGAWISLFHWDGVSLATPAGLSNYTEAFSDPAVRQALAHSAVLVLFYSALPVALGLVLAGVIAQQRLRLVGLWRTVLFVPQALSIVVVGVAWQWLLQTNGPVNELLRLVGLGSLARGWLGDFAFALPAQGLIGTWMLSGLCVVLLMAGVQSIDASLYDAARVDGAGAIREFFAVTVPGLRNTIVVCGVLTFASSLNNFGLIWVTTKGGPGDSTQVMSTLIYTRAFVLSDLGGASALAIMLGLVMMLTSYAIARRTEPA